MNLRLERFGERTEDFVDSVESAIHLAVPKNVRSRRDPRQNTVVNITWRALVLLVGLFFVCLGIVLLVLPGPGWGSILLGLAILASEYTWANRLLAPIRRRVRTEANRARGLTRRQQVLLGAVLIAGTIAFASWVSWAVSNAHLTLPWQP